MKKIIVLLSLLLAVPFMMANAAGGDSGNDSVSDNTPDTPDTVEVEIEHGEEDGERRGRGRGEDDAPDTDEDEPDHQLGLTEAEAELFTNETVVKIELNDVKHIFTTGTTERAAIVSEIADRFNVTSTEVEAVLLVEVEDRASRPEDKD